MTAPTGPIDNVRLRPTIAGRMSPGRPHPDPAVPSPELIAVLCYFLIFLFIAIETLEADVLGIFRAYFGQRLDLREEQTTSQHHILQQRVD